MHPHMISVSVPKHKCLIANFTLEPFFSMLTFNVLFHMSLLFELLVAILALKRFFPGMAVFVNLMRLPRFKTCVAIRTPKIIFRKYLENILDHKHTYNQHYADICD